MNEYIAWVYSSSLGEKRGMIQVCLEMDQSGREAAFLYVVKPVPWQMQCARPIVEALYQGGSVAWIEMPGYLQASHFRSREERFASRGESSLLSELNSRVR